ncbi:MAG: ABC transporter ATP-binding protein, partial [Bacilli bacterium]
KLLLLDEHTAALDPQTALKVMEITNNIVINNDITTIMITHNINQALKYGNRLIVLNNGRIVASFNQQEKDLLTIEDIMNIYKDSTLSSLSDSMIID